MAKRARRRSSLPPDVQRRPGLGAEILGEIAPLLADGGIDLDDLERCDPQRLQEALNRAAEEAGDGDEPTVGACIGVSLGLLDNWLSTTSGAPARLVDLDLPFARTDAERAAVQIVTLARRGDASATLGFLVSEHGGKTLLLGCVMALSAVARAWSAESDQSVARVLFDHLR